MLYRIKYICDEVDGFVREIKIDSDSSFLDLCKVILKSCNYPDDQMTEFFVCDDEWERHEQITREDMGNDDIDTDVYLMAKTPLCDFIEDKGQHFEFVFDPYAERSFFLDVKEIIPGEHLKKPEIIRVKGEAPQQLLDFDDPFVEKITKASAAGGAGVYDDDLPGFYDGDEGFNDDELDLEGFEISDGSEY
jgi:hypothetical protein